MKLLPVRSMAPAAALLMVSLAASALAQKAVVVVRHAE